MIDFQPQSDEIESLIRQSLKEDLGKGDITTESILTEPRFSRAELLSKEALVLCGGELCKKIFLFLNSGIKVETHFREGDFIPSGSILISLEGDAATILKRERTALNFLQHLSGIATKTRGFVEKARPVKVLDTRKTHPGLRRLEKYAVACGGGENHRLGLFDAILIKDNHIRIVGKIADAITQTRKVLGKDKFIEIEVTTLEQLQEAIDSKVHRVLLDNMSIGSIRKAVKIVAGRAEIEVSGSLTLDELEQLSKSGIDFVSIGSITHSAPWVDISLNFVK